MNITAIFNWIWKNRRVVIAIAVAIIIMLWLNECSRSNALKQELKAEKERSNQNLAALTENLQQYVNENGDTSYQKPVAEMSIEEIKQHFPLLYDAIKAESGEVKYIVQQKIVYRDTGSVINTINELSEDNYALEFNYISEDSVLTLVGESRFTAFPYMAPDEKLALKLFPGKTIFEDTKIQFGLTTGVRKDKDGIDRIFITPSTSKITITDIQGADLTNFLKERDKQTLKKKKFGVGLQIGYGLNFARQNAINHGVYVGAGLNYNLIRF